MITRAIKILYFIAYGTRANKKTYMKFLPPLRRFYYNTPEFQYVVQNIPQNNSISLLVCLSTLRPDTIAISQPNRQLNASQQNICELSCKNKSVETYFMSKSQDLNA
jgi:hypothetical protein